jgi:hypothetical protein
MLRRLLAGTLTVCITSSPAASGIDAPAGTQFDLRGAAVYSNMCYEPEAGDVDGLRVFVRPIEREPRIVAQYAEGGLPPLVAAPSHVVAGRLVFTVPGDVPEATFAGEVHSRYLVMHSGADAKRFRLRRVQSRRHIPNC